MQKARRHIPKNAPTACRHAVSCTISLPFRGTISPFPHGTSPLSVTREYLALEGGPPRFSPRFTGADLLRNAHRQAQRFRLRDDCPLWCTVPRASSIAELCNCRQVTHDLDRAPYNPRPATRARLHRPGLGSDPLSLATTRGVSVDFLSSRY